MILRLFLRVRARMDFWICEKIHGHRVARNANRTACWDCGYYYTWED